MDVEQVDERSATWEESNPRLRVYLYEGGGGESSWAVDCYDLVGTGVLGAIQWAQDHVPAAGAWALCILRDDEGRPPQDRQGIVWLEGGDPNRGFDTPRDAWEAWEAEQVKAMLQRRDRQVVRL